MAEKEENILTIEENGNVRFTDGNIKVDNVTEKNWDDIKDYVKCKRHVNDEINLASEALKKADDEFSKKIATERLNRALDFKQDLIDDFQKKLKSMHKERTELSDAVNNPIISPLLALVEGYYRRRKQILANLPDDRMLVSEEIKKLLEQPTLEAKQDYLQEKGLPIKIIDNSNKLELAEGKELPIQKKDCAFVILTQDKNGNENIIPVLDEKTLLDLSSGKNVGFNRLMQSATGAKLYAVDKNELMTNFATIALSANKTNAVEALPSATFITQATNHNHEVKQLNSINPLEQYNKSISAKLLPSYDAQKHTIDPSKVNWAEIAKLGINVEKLSADDINKLLSGKPTGLLDNLKKDKDGNILKSKSKLVINKNEHGIMTYGIIPALEKPNIPNKIFDYTLSEKEKAELLKNGRLSKAITVTVSNQKKTIIPFIDKSTNQLLLCNVDKLKLPNKYKGVELSEKHKQELLKGHTVAVGGLLDNQGVPYNGYARINPANGKIEDIPVANLEHKRQVAANNFGERTESLSRDKDTTIGRAQQKNNDAPKPKLNNLKVNKPKGFKM